MPQGEEGEGGGGVRFILSWKILWEEFFYAENFGNFLQKRWGHPEGELAREESSHTPNFQSKYFKI